MGIGLGSKHYVADCMYASSIKSINREVLPMSSSALDVELDSSSLTKRFAASVGSSNICWRFLYSSSSMSKNVDKKEMEIRFVCKSIQGLNSESEEQNEKV